MNLGGTLTEVIPVEDDSQVGQTRRRVLQLAADIGFDATDAGRAALVATELATNVLKHARLGEVHLRLVPCADLQGLEIIAVDRGPGFDAQRCLRDGFSTGGTQGNGLGAISRQAQVFDLYSDERGSVILARLYPRATQSCDLRFGVSQHAQRHETACGDGWHLAVDAQRICVLVVDGLGHGEDAAKAALAGTTAFAEHPFDPPETLIADMHRSMQGTRGGAAAIAQFDARDGNVKFAGIGNIGARLASPTGSRGMASHPGIVGVQFRKVHTFTQTVAGGQLMLLFSDGLQSRWDLQDYPGLVSQHPAVVAAVLHRDFCRGRDDATILVIELEVPHG
ncbi:ATP-binding SpoIIE family protein phosphatase [Halopseudomonas xinjiangensis]|uniref:ATP-binding SpoIIE family protein phosphatase n=1 Tax=Halopseudomonas xinjiangensis TaxID=487184 RepID=UPI000B87560E|nr:ATP-binding SpoIIE family protein phosphatase [Halopseudomonas xinjiangensis]